MAIYGIIYALLENDMRRILAYWIINQVGFMVCAVGIGVPMALDGAVAHAFCHIIYKSLLWMSAGAVHLPGGQEQVHRPRRPLQDHAVESAARLYRRARNLRSAAHQRFHQQDDHPRPPPTRAWSGRG